MNKKDWQHHETSGIQDASDGNFNTEPEKSPVDSDISARRHSIRADQPETTVVKNGTDTEKGFTTASSQDNDDPTPQGHWRETICISGSKRNTILQIAIWLVFTG